MGLTTEMRLPSATPKEGHHFTYVGKFRYAITLPVHGAKPLFADGDVVRDVLGKLSDYSRTTHFEVIAYCFLPDRLSLVVGGKEDTSDLREFLRAFRGACTLPRAGGAPAIALWSRRYLERVVRKSEDLRAVVREIYRLPVTAGLSKTPAEYPYQGSFTGLGPGVTSPRGTGPRKTGSRFPAARRRQDGGKRGSRPGER